MKQVIVLSALLVLLLSACTPGTFSWLDYEGYPGAGTRMTSGDDTNNTVTEGPTGPVEEDPGTGSTPGDSENPIDDTPITKPVCPPCPVDDVDPPSEPPVEPPVTDNCVIKKLPDDSALEGIEKCPGEPANPIHKRKP